MLKGTTLIGKPNSKCSKKELEARLEFEGRLATKVYEMFQKAQKKHLQAYKDIIKIREQRGYKTINS